MLYYIHIKAYILQLHIHNAKAEESSAGKKIYIKTTKYKKCPKLPMGSKVAPVDDTFVDSLALVESY